MYNFNDFIKSKKPARPLQLIKKILFYISLFILLLPLITAIDSFFNGTQGLCIFGGCPVIYGFDAFRTTFTLAIAIYTTIIPVLPIALIYAIYYLVSRKLSSSHHPTPTPQQPKVTKNQIPKSKTRSKPAKKSHPNNH